MPALFIFGSRATAQQVAGEAVFQAAFGDLGAATGQVVSTREEARLICNNEKYLVSCAEIGKKYGLYSPDAEVQAMAVLEEIKKGIINDLQSCDSESCLLEAASKLGKALGVKEGEIAKKLDLTSEAIKKKEAVVGAAKDAGVSLSECRDMNPDTALVTTLRACAKLVKDTRVQEYIPKENIARANLVDPSVELRIALKEGRYQCGDGTLDSCGNFCLNPSEGARKQGVAGIPQVCLEIANKFFGPDGAAELQSAYTAVQKVGDVYKQRAQEAVFTTSDGRKLYDPAEIGKYMEERGRAGDVSAAEKGMNFMVANGFVSQDDADFALKIVRKIGESGGVSDFNVCQKNPENCRGFVLDELRGHFEVADKIQSIMILELQKEGVASPNFCGDPRNGNACLKASERALPAIEKLAADFPEAKAILEDIKRRLDFSKQGFEARTKAEKEISTGNGIIIGGKEFKSFEELDQFCKRNGQACLTDAAKSGLINSDTATKRYELSFEKYYQVPGQGRPSFQPPSRGMNPGYPTGTQTNVFYGQEPFNGGPGFPAGGIVDKEKTLKMFKEWLDNPQGPPPVPFPSYPEKNQASYYPLPAAGGGLNPDVERCLWQAGVPVSDIDFVRRGGDRNSTSRPEIIRGCFENPAKVVPPAGQKPLLPIACPMVQPRICASGEQPIPPRSGDPCGIPSCVVEYGPKNPESSQGFPFVFSGGKKVNSYDEAKTHCYAAAPSNKSVSFECESRFGIFIKTPDTAYCPPPSYWDPAAQNCKNDTTVYPVSGQVKKTWTFSDGSESSYILSRADSEYINYLKSVDSQCRGISRAKFFWRSGAGDSRSDNWRNFGIPDCSGIGSGNAGTVSCSEALVKLLGSGCHQMYNDSFGKTVYCDGPMTKSAKEGDASATAGCSSGSSYPAQCPSGQYWSGSACVSNSSTSNMKNCFYPNATKDGKSVGYTVWCEADYYNCHEGSPSGAQIGLTGLSLGAPSTCDSGWQATSCPSGQYWNGSACVNTSPTDCLSGQYWNGLVCVSSTSKATTTQPVPSAEDQCYKKYGTGWVTKETTTGNCYDSYSPNFKASDGKLYSCSGIPQGVSAPGCPGATSPTTTTGSSGTCPSGQYWSGSACVASGSTTGSTGWVNHAWVFSDGKTQFSSILGRSDSEYLNYIAGIDAQCKKISSSNFCWKPNAGNQSDWQSFGIPDCSGACASGSGGTITGGSGTCASGKYWNGTACVNSSPTSCPSGQYWNGSACVTGSTGGSSSCTQELINLLGSGCHYMYSDSTGKAIYCDGPMTKSAKVGDTTMTSGCSGSSGGGGSCPSGQYWNGSACVNSNTTSCSSGQYWNGSACVSSSSTSCPSGQYWNGSACVNTTPTDCPSGQYWNGSACATGSYSSDPATGCAQAGGTWNSTTNYCQMPSPSSSLIEAVRRFFRGIFSRF